MMLKWLEFLTIGLGIIWLLAIFFTDNVIFIGVVVFVLFIGFFGISQVPVFNKQWVYEGMPDTITLNNPGPILANIDIAPDLPRYAKSGLTEGEAIKVLDQLENLMRRDKLFTNVDLTLNDLALKLDIHPNKLSQAINSITSKTFYHYINTWRIEEFLARAADSENRKYTFLSLAYDCGFNSKTTFNKYFKLQTGKSPSDYFNN